MEYFAANDSKSSVYLGGSFLWPSWSPIGIRNRTDPYNKWKMSKEPAVPTGRKGKHTMNNRFVESMFDMTLITVNICQICYILKVGPGLGFLYYLLLGLFGVSLVMLFLHGFMSLFGRLKCSKPLPNGCFNCLYNASLFMVVLVYLVNLVGNVLSLKEAENKCQLMLQYSKGST